MVFVTVRTNSVVGFAAVQFCRIVIALPQGKSAMFGGEMLVFNATRTHCRWRCNANAARFGFRGGSATAGPRGGRRCGGGYAVFFDFFPFSAHPNSPSLSITSIHASTRSMVDKRMSEPFWSRYTNAPPLPDSSPNAYLDSLCRCLKRSILIRNSVRVVMHARYLCIQRVSTMAAYPFANENLCVDLSR